MKKILIAIALLAGVQTQTSAQVLKKIGQAIGKVANAAEKITQGTNSQQSQGTATDKQPVSQTQAGQTTIKIEGNMRGLELKWVGALRIYGSTNVNLRYQFVNTSSNQLNVGIGEWNSDSQVYVTDSNGNRYDCQHVFMGGSGMQFSNGCKMAAGVKDMVTLRFANVPTNVMSLDKAIIRFMVGINSNEWNKPTIMLSDIPISLLPSITAKGVCGEQKVLIGSTISALPKTFANLYDAYTVSTEDDEGETVTTITFTLNGQETMTAISNDQKTIANIDVRTPNVYVLVGKTYYTCGNRLNKLKGESGTQTDDYGNVSYQNMYFDEDTQGNICAIHI